MTKALDQFIGSTAYDKAGNKIGKINQLYVDQRSSQPQWASVHTGLFGMNESLIPLAGAAIDGDKLSVAVDKDEVKNAPHFDTTRGVTPEQAQELLHHYHLDSPSIAGRDADGNVQGLGDHRTGLGDNGENRNQATDEVGDRGRGVLGLDTDADRSGMRASGLDTGESMTRSEERLRVGTETEEAGRARLVRHVETDQQSVTVPVTHEEVRVEREPITGADATAGRGKLSDAEQEVVLHQDRVTVERENVPVERVRLGVDQVTEDQTITEQVRKEQIETEGVEGMRRPDSPRHSER